MKKVLVFLVSLAVVFGVFAANYTADTIGVKDQSNEGNVKVKYFSWAAGTTAVASNSTVALAILPPNARIIDGALGFGAFGSSTTLDLGLRGANGGSYIKGTTANDPDLLLDGIDVSSASTDTFANLVNGDSNADYELGVYFVELYATSMGSTWATNKTITGWVKYIEP